ncbi:MAG: vWA domain-containing protein, partial [Planctomycetota bacterium]
MSIRTAWSRGFLSAMLLSLFALFLGVRTGFSQGTGAAEEYECLTTPNGIPRKVIIKKQGVVAYENQDFTGREQPLKFFRKYFVFKESGQGFLIGEATREASTLGWVRNENCLAWDNQQALFFINKKGEDRVPVRAWREKADIGKSGRPHFEENLDRDFTTEPFPILENDTPFVQVAFLWDAEGPIPSLQQDLAEGGGDQTEAELLQGKKVSQGTHGKKVPEGQEAAQQIVEKARRMDVVLVIDVTGSMGDYMSQVRSKLVEIVESLERMTKEGPQITAYVGVVAYRDYADRDSTFLSKKMDLTSDMAAVKAFLNSADFQPGGGAGRNEAVCDALFEACQLPWGEHAFRVICLVGDAPPHTADDDDIRTLRSSGAAPESAFFGKSFDASADVIKAQMAKQRIVFFPISVAGYEDTAKAFKQLANEPERFLDLTDASSFIRGLEKELDTTRAEHDAGLAKVEAVAEGRVALSELKDKDIEFFKAINIDPASLAEMRKELIQTGWFQPSVGKDVTIAVYLKRKQLEDWAEQLRSQLETFREKQPDIFAGIASMSTGDDFRALDLNQLSRVAGGVPFKPELL